MKHLVSKLDHATETHLNRIVCKVLMENNARMSDMQKVTIKR